jgi:hypothetical protein
MSKRRNITLLPPVHQTDELKRLFGSTVDQLFQPGATDQVSGYIGRKPAYFDADRDFYKIEPSADRAARQLEPSVVTVDEAGSVTGLVFYDDFVNHLRAAGAPTASMDRLLASPRYSWAPPVDLDKLLNFQNYYWAGEDVAPTEMYAPTRVHVASNAQLIFALPDPISAWGGAADLVVVKVNDTPVHGFTVAGGNVILAAIPDTGSVIKIARYADLVATITGLESAVNPTTGEMLSSGQRVHIIDGVRDGVYWVEGVGRSISFVNDIEDYRGDRPYVVIDRTCKSRNVWSRRNRWVHRGVLPDASIQPSQQAVRPIIEFEPEMVLFDYGTYRLADVSCTLSGPAIQLASIDYPERPISIADINGLRVGSVRVDGDHILVPGDRMLARQAIAEWSPKTFFAKDAVVYYLGETYRSIADHVSGAIFSSSKWISDPLASVNNQIFEIEEVLDGSTSVYGLLIQTDTGLGAVTQLKNSEIEYWFNGTTWDVAQGFSAAPLFNLYDKNGVGFSDSTVYPKNDFTGTKLFAYAQGSGTTDPYIGHPLKYNEYGQIVFENHMETMVLHSGGGEISTARFYAYDRTTGIELDNSWHLNVEDIQLFDGSVPINLQANPDNETPDYISRNQWFEHFSQILTSQENFTGEPYSINNWRDTPRDLGRGRSVLQHNGSMIRPMVLASDDTFNVIDAILYTRNEYETFIARFLRRFEDLINSSSISPHASIASWVDSVLTNLIVTKQSDYAFALSAMGGGQFFIPPTPSFLGILPCYKPQMITRDGLTYIQGHDGSLRTIIGNEKDALLFEFETRIYNSIPDDFKTETAGFNLSEQVAGFFPNILDTQFTRDEFLSVISPRFEYWCQTRGIDYRTNEMFSPEDRFTWNYSSIKDAHGRNFDGHWRGIYRYFYGTERPHLAPWEMLGFGDMPTWWVDAYGPAPYTSGNQQMWDDIEHGRIVQGERAGISPHHMRPGLMPVYAGASVLSKGYLPVDEGGDLLDPILAHVVSYEPSVTDAMREWKFGDGADVETLWMQSYGYRFDLCIALYLMRPVLFIERGWDTRDEIMGPNGQLISKTTGKRPHMADTIVHGERIAGAQHVAYGVQQWLSDFLIIQGRTPDVLGDAMRRSSVRLAHRVAGFTTFDNLSLATDNFGIVPQEDIQIILHQGNSYREEFYSGMITEWTGEGYRIYGFDPANCFFPTFEIDEYAQKTRLQAATTNERAINPWQPTTYYTGGSLVSHDGVVYACFKAHTSSSKFEGTFWELQTGRAIPDTSFLYIPRITTYVKNIPYGTVYNNRQDVINVILGYAAYLESRGWVFDTQDGDGISDWISSARSFANWSALNWEEGYFLALSPSARAVKFTSDSGTILNVEKNLNGFYGIYDRSGQPIPRETSAVNRDEDSILITAGDSDIFGARVRIADIEHAIVLSNETIFGDTIYQPLYNLRQPRLKVSMLRAGEWVGRYDAPGYIIVNGEIKPSFDKSAENLRTMFDIERADDPTLRDYARHVVGFQKRDYLTALNLSDTQQFEFYQGLIQNKGSVGAFDRLLRSNIIGQNRNLQFREEWAVRIGEYGANLPFNRWEVEIRKDDIKSQNQFFCFDPTVVRDDWANLQTDTGRWVSTPTGMSHSDFSFALTMDKNDKALPSAGYARTNEATFIARDMASLILQVNAYYDAGNDLAVNMRAWVMDNGAGDWTMYKVRHLSSTGQANTIIQAASDTIADEPVTRLFTHETTGLTLADVGRTIAIIGTLDTVASIDGMMTIGSVDIDDGSFTIEQDIFQGIEYTGVDGDVGPGICILEPVRFATLAARNAAPSSMWAAGDLAYVDDADNGTWAVFSHDGLNFTRVRSEGSRVANETFKSTALYHLGTTISKTAISPQPLILDRIALVDPTIGVIAGAADREITYKLEYDPAVYNGDAAWGINEVGKLWWDLSTVRFLNPYTNDLSRTDLTPAEIATELDYRATNWSKIAPGMSVDVYEWVRSELIPQDWIQIADLDTTGTYAGEIYLEENAPFLISSEYSNQYKAVRTFYYFWVKNRINVPTGAGRNLSAYSVAQMITNPAKSDLTWIAPISEYGMLIGNISEYLEQNNTILQIDFEANVYDGPVHRQWALVRIGDEQSAPPERIWRKITDSLVGFDNNLAAIPDPALHVYSSVGAMDDPRQSIFARRDGDVRKGLMDARKSFVEMINYMLARHDYAADHLSEVEDLLVESPLSDRLAWVQPDNSTYVEPLPPQSEYDMVVTTIEERDHIFTSKIYTKFMSPSPWDSAGWEELPWDADFTTSPRILLNGLDSPRPFWSVWEVDLNSIPDNSTKADLEAMVNTGLIATKTFNYEVNSIAARNALPDIKSGDRVLVRDTTSDDFWTIWAYFENASEKYTAGFNLVNAQKYRTSDFLSRADWYADGYDVTRPPVIRYRTAAERNAAERDAPTSMFVRVDDDGLGNWLWTIFDDVEQIWITVAHQNGTIQLSERLFDYDRPVYGWNGVDDVDFSPENAAERDGSFELRVLCRMLSDEGLLSPLELNELFFSVVHFVHSQQDQVDWLIPTSYMSVIGYKEPLRASAIATPDNIDTILQYLDEVKPYRVKTREFVRGLISDEDVIRVRASDFDKPAYFDETTKAYRRLDPTKPNDADILRTAPWTDWSVDPSSDRVRKITTTITYDRVWPNASEGVQSGAAYYIDQYYAPSDIMKEKNFDTLLDLDFKGTIIDGRRIVDGDAQQPDIRIVGTSRADAEVVINGAGDPKFTYMVNDTYLSANKPEELCVVKADDALVISIESGWGAGVPSQLLMGMDATTTTGTTIRSKLNFIPQNKSNIMIWQDGKRVDTSTISIDHFSATVDLPLVKADSSRASRVAIRAIGYGSSTTMINQKFMTADGGSTIAMTIPANARAAIEINGVNRDDLIASSNASGITLSSAPAVGSQIIVTILSSNGIRLSATTTNLTYTAAKTWTVPVKGSENGIRHSAAIVERNGIRLQPPKTYYGAFGATNRSIVLYSLPTTPVVEVWLNGVLDNSKTDVVDGALVPKSTTFMCADVRVVVRGDQQFDLVGGTLTVPGAVAGDTIMVTSFDNSDSLNIKTHVRNGISTGEYLVPAPLDQNYVWVTVNGILALENYDYVIEAIIDAYDTNPKDYTYFDSQDDRRKFRFLTGHTSTDRIVITTFGTNVASPPSLKQLSTKTRSTSRHTAGSLAKARNSYGWVVGSGLQGNLDPSAWELNVLNYDQKGGVLISRVDSDSETISIRSNPNALPGVLIDSAPFETPDPALQKPGVVWISGERIEYYAIEKAGSTYVLSQLRRGTHNTFISIFYSTGEAVYSANVQSSNFDRVI